MNIELTLTAPDSDLHVVRNGDFLLLYFKEENFRPKIKKIPGWDFNNRFEKTWSIPRESLNLLSELLGEFIIWKPKEQLINEINLLKEKDESLNDVLERIKPKFESDNLKITPFDFQKIGINWILEEKGKARVKGGILADLMGLGKTIQALSTSVKLKELGKIRNCLVITPATLKQQWAQEISNCTYEKSIIVEGTRKKRIKQFEKINENNVFYTIINYELLRQGYSDFNKKTSDGFNDLKEVIKNNYDMVIIDEAHRFKNPDTATAKAIRMISQPEYRLLLTGTPLEKDLENIFQLIDYISPNILSNEKLSFEERKQQFEDLFLVTSWNPFTYFFKEKMIVRVKNESLLNEKVSPYILRRTSEEELPDEIIKNIIIPWENEQLKLFKRAESLSKDLLNTIKNIDNEKEKEEKENQRKIFGLIKQAIANTPELAAQFNSPLAKRILGKKKKFPKSYKLRRLIEMCEQIIISSKEKIVIFTQSERMTRIIRDELLELSKKLSKEKGKEYKFNVSMYTGQVPKTCERKDKLADDEIDCNGCPFFQKCDSRFKEQWKFQNEPNVRIIICNDAANYGVNLQRGKVLINFDLPDNYAIYSQRNGRIRRLGSEHSKIYIFNLIIKDFEEKKFQRLMKQKEIFDKIVEKTEDEKKAIELALQKFKEQEIEDILT